MDILSIYAGVRMVSKRKTPKKTAAVKKQRAVVAKQKDPVFDINSVDWGDCRLTPLHKLFVLWYTYPPIRRDATEAARKAGYKDTNNLHKNIYHVMQREDIKKAIALVESRYLTDTADEVYRQIIARKKARVNFNGGEFYDISDGKAVLKDYDSLTEEQKMCIDGLTYEGGKGIPTYVLPHRKDEEAFFVDLHNRLHPVKENGDGFDVEATVDVIRGKLQVKAKMMRDNAEITAMSDLSNRSENRSEED